MITKSQNVKLEGSRHLTLKPVTPSLLCAMRKEKADTFGISLICHINGSNGSGLQDKDSGDLFLLTAQARAEVGFICTKFTDIYLLTGWSYNFHQSEITE